MPDGHQHNLLHDQKHHSAGVQVPNITMSQLHAVQYPELDPAKDHKNYHRIGCSQGESIMNAICKALATTTVVLAGSVFASLASAAEIPTSATPQTSLTGSATSAPTGLIPTASKQNTIKVAGRYRRRWRGRRFYRRRRGWSGPGIAAGIIAGAATAAILSHSYRRYPRYGYGYRCDRLYYRCHELGYRGSCRRFYRHCD